MTDLEQARELLAAEYDKAGEKIFASRSRSGHYDNDPDVRAISAALRAAPDGFRLVPATLSTVTPPRDLRTKLGDA